MGNIITKRVTLGGYLFGNIEVTLLVSSYLFGKKRVTYSVRKGLPIR
jgi:hypothetical protein